MSRLLVVLALVAGVTTLDATVADAKSRQTEVSKKKKKKKKKRDDRRVTKRTKPNMPRGFTWPPSRRMEKQADACEARLDELGVDYQTGKREGRMVRAIKVPASISGIALTPVYKKNQSADCQLVLALASFAPQLYELGVREIRYGSAFRWSKVRVSGKTKNILSRHGLGVALDIVAFVDDTGREANVERDYRHDDELLLGIEQAVNDSGQFRLLLTPRNDPRSHHDHFHLEANPDYTDTSAGRTAS